MERKGNRREGKAESGWRGKVARRKKRKGKRKEEGRRQERKRRRRRKWKGKGIEKNGKAENG